MVAERKKVKGAVQQPAEPAHLSRQPGRANRGFRSMDPERQREGGDESDRPPPRSGTTLSEEGARPPRGRSRDDAQGAVRRANNPGQTQEPGGT